MNFAAVKQLNVNGKSAVRLKIGDKVLWKGLPSGYTQLDYIECTGPQYIDTGFIPNQDTRAVVELMYFGGNGVYGARNTTSSNGFCLRTISKQWQAQYNDKLSTVTKVDYDTEWHVADQNKNILYLDGITACTFTYAEFSAPHALVLGGIMANRSDVKTLYEGSGRYRSCQLYDNGVLVRDLVPCRNPAGEIGMYDTVNAVFYGNAGTGELVAGDPV